MGNVPGFTGYTVTPGGDIYGKYGRRLVQQITNKGYLSVMLMCDKTRKAKRLLTHRMVASAFVENPSGLPHVNHKNGIKRDNRADNLEWVTPSQNNKHSLEIGLRKRKITDEDVARIRERYSAGESVSLIAGNVGVNRTTVYRALNGATYADVGGPMRQDWMDARFSGGKRVIK